MPRKLAKPLKIAIERLGLQPRRLLGAGAEGVAILLTNDKVIKFWFDEEYSSYDFWLEVYRGQFGAEHLPRIHMCGTVTLDQPYVDPDGFKHVTMPYTIMDRVMRHIDIDASLCPHIPKKYAIESEYVYAINSSDGPVPPPIVSTPLCLSMYLIAKRLRKFGYREIGLQLGWTADKRLVFYDVI